MSESDKSDLYNGFAVQRISKKPGVLPKGRKDLAFARTPYIHIGSIN
jgi:hypothetical protein